jgi:hypothetical protein
MGEVRIEEEAMSAGLFLSSCPECGGELVADRHGNSACTSCDRLYLNRFGHLIPIDPHVSQLAPPALPVSQG